MVYRQTTLRVRKGRSMGEQSKTAPLTMAVTHAGKLIGLSRNASYEAVRRGEIPTIRIGRRIFVPVAAFHRMLDVQSKQQIVAAELVRPLQRDERDSVSRGEKGENAAQLGAPIALKQTAAVVTADAGASGDHAGRHRGDGDR
jgi:hypothetical protein